MRDHHKRRCEGNQSISHFWTRIRCISDTDNEQGGREYNLIDGHDTWQPF